jgi:hypothetical protein
MSQMGLLSLENRHRMIPLRISEKLVNDLEKLDQLHEYVNSLLRFLSLMLKLNLHVRFYYRRDCVSASVYYVRSGALEYDQIINPSTISEDFEKFLNSLGWPVINNNLLVCELIWELKCLNNYFLFFLGIY